MHQNTLRLIKRLSLLCWAILYVNVCFGQDADSARNTEAKTLFDAFKHGTPSGKFRYYFSSTMNKGALSDYYANAAGGYLKFTTKPFHGFQFAAGGSFTFNLGSSDMTKTDSITGARSRYESALFDLADGKNRFNMTRLDELQLIYDLDRLFKDKAGQGSITWGKQLINTPFINEQDGRMRPSAVDAVWLNYHRKKLGIEGGWIYAMAPRGYTNWYSVGQSLGTYGQGVNPNGVRGNYKNNLNTDGVALLGLKYNDDRLDVALWEEYIENVLNTLMLQPEYKLLQKNKTSLTLGTQLIRQDVVNNGGNRDSTKAYSFKLPGNWTSSSKLEFRKAGRDNNSWYVSLNYTRIGANNRFMAPREWGKEPFYTFIPRERTEGTGNSQAFVIKGGKEFFNRKLLTELYAGAVRMPDITNYKLNKYGNLSYDQVYVRVMYTFDKALKGFTADLIYVYKKNEGNDYGNLRNVINRVDMSLVNFIINYRF